MLNRLKAYIVIVIVLVLASCGGGGQPGNSVIDTEPVETPADNPSIGGLPGFDALGEIPGRESSSITLQRKGSQFEPNLVQRVTVDEDNALFDPAWDPGNPGAGEMAYAGYLLNLEGFSSANRLHFGWSEAPVDLDDLSIGLSNWGESRWDWFPCPTGKELDFGESGLGEYTAEETGDLCLIVVLLGQEQAALESVRVSQGDSPAWPMYGHDPQHTGRSPYVGPETNNLKWTFKTSGKGFNFSNPCVCLDGSIVAGAGPELRAYNPDGTVKWSSDPFWPASSPTQSPDGTIYITSSAGLHAFDETGVMKWTFEFQGYGSSSWYRATFRLPAPAVGLDGAVYIYDTFGYFYAIEPDGSQRWVVNNWLSSFIKPAISADGSVVIRDNAKICSFDGTGTGNWSYQHNERITANPAVNRQGDVFFCSDDGYMYSYEADGEFRWRFNAEAHICSSPVIGDDQVIYIACNDGRMYAVNPDGSMRWIYVTGRRFVGDSLVVSPSGMVVVCCTSGEVCVINPDGTLARSTYVGNCEERTPAVGQDGSIYLSCGDYRKLDGSMIAVDPNGDIAWSAYAGWSIENSPVIGADGTAYLGNSDGRVYAINPDGSLSWMKETGSVRGCSPVLGWFNEIYHGAANGNLTTMKTNGVSTWDYDCGDAIQTGLTQGPDGTVYVVSDDNELSAIAPDRTVKWIHQFSGPFHVSAGCRHSPAVAVNGTVYIGCNKQLFAFNTDGSVKWTLDVGQHFRSSPSIDQDGNIYLCIDSDELISLDPAGNIRWTREIDLSNCAPGIGADGTIYVSSRNGLHAFNPDGTQQWLFGDNSVRSGTALAIDSRGIIYFGSIDGYLFAVNPDGTQLWMYDARGWMGSPAIGPDGTLYVGCEDGQLYAFGPGPGN